MEHIIVRFARGQMQSGQMHDGRQRDSLESPLLYLIPLVLALLLLRGFGMELFRVEGVSMHPRFRSGQTLFVNRAAYGIQSPLGSTYLYRWTTPQVGEIVVYTSPDHGELAVKRVIGSAGAQYDLGLNGISFRIERPGESESEWLPPIPVSARVHETMRGEGRLARNEVFLVGDNRSDSIDSRTYGPVDIERIRGRVIDIRRFRFIGSVSGRQ